MSIVHRTVAFLRSSLMTVDGGLITVGRGGWERDREKTAKVEERLRMALQQEDASCYACNGSLTSPRGTHQQQRGRDPIRM